MYGVSLIQKCTNLTPQTGLVTEVGAKNLLFSFQLKILHK